MGSIRTGVVSIPRPSFAVDLRKLHDAKIIDCQGLFNSFADYFADWLMFAAPINTVDSDTYPPMLEAALGCLVKEKVADHPSKSLKMLIAILQSDRREHMKRRVRDFFLGEEVVKLISSDEFYEAMVQALSH